MKRILAMTLVFLAAALAQLDPGMIPATTFDLYEAGNRVGELYVPARPMNATRWEEHWVLFPTYVYPASKTLATLELAPRAGNGYKSAEDFFRRVPFARGSRYAHAVSDEYGQLPAVQ